MIERVFLIYFRMMLSWNVFFFFARNKTDNKQELHRFGNKIKRWNFHRRAAKKSQIGMNKTIDKKKRKKNSRKKNKEIVYYYEAYFIIIAIFWRRIGVIAAVSTILPAIIAGLMCTNIRTSSSMTIETQRAVSSNAARMSVRHQRVPNNT